MFLDILAIGLLAITAVAQEPGRPANHPPPVPELYGTDTPEPAEPCSPTTGREWICKIDWWDPYDQRLLDSKDAQRCDDRDLCYLGPLVSCSLSEPWQRKWMCGPKPCRVEGNDNNRQLQQDCPGPDDTCDVGPYDIVINGTQLRATFCNSAPKAENRDELDEIVWAPQLCSINSSLGGFSQLKGCEGGELCRRGPINFWNDGEQYRAFICTKTPSRPMPSQRTEPQEKLYAMHTALEEIGDALVLNGHVLRRGPHDRIYSIGKKMMNLQKHIEFAEQKLKDMGQEGPILLSAYAMELLEPIRVEILLLDDEVDSLLGEGDANQVMNPLSWAFKELLLTVNGGMGPPTLDVLMSWVHQHLQKLLSFVNRNDLENPLAKAAFFSTHDVMMQVKEALKKHENNGRTLDAIKTMGMNMQKLWMIMSEGPMMPGVTRAGVAMCLVDDFKQLQKELLSMKSPEDRIEDIWETIKELQQIFRQGMVKSEMARKVFNKIHDKLVLMNEFVQNMPDNRRAMEVMKRAVEFIQETWNHISGGPVRPVSLPEIALQGVMDALGELKNHLRPGRSEGGSPPQGYGGRDALQQAQDTLSGLRDRLNPGGPSSQRGNDDIRAQINRLQDTITKLRTQMMDTRTGNMGMDRGGSMRNNNDMGMGRDTMRDNNGMGMEVEGYTMGDDMGYDGEDFCPEPFWMGQIPAKEKIKWSPAVDAFMGPEPPVSTQRGVRSQG